MDGSGFPLATREFIKKEQEDAKNWIRHEAKTGPLKMFLMTPDPHGYVKLKFLFYLFVHNFYTYTFSGQGEQVIMVQLRRSFFLKNGEKLFSTCSQLLHLQVKSLF